MPHKAKHLDDFSGRIRIIGILLFFIAGILIYRLFNLQIVSANYYREKANRQYIASQSKSPIASRGTIYFKEKSGQLVSAATIKEGYDISINPSVLKNAETVYEEISKIIAVDREDFLKKSKKNSVYELIYKHAETETGNALKELGIEGLEIVPSQWRFYPGGKLASQVLGFVGFKGDELAGRYGIEKAQEDYLKSNVESNVRNSFTDAFLGLSRDFFLGSQKANDVILTIEPAVQGFLETALEKIMSRYSAESSGGIIIDPKTGKILAMAAKPDFDPNFYNKVENNAVFLNPLISNVFEMGSVMKPLTISSGLDTGSITPQTTYFDAGHLVIDKSKIGNYDGKARGKVDMQAVLDESLNTGAVFAMRQMGKEKFENYMLNFGLGEKTGVDLPDEVKGNLSGLIKNLNNSREIEYATASFGQGIAVTPLEFSMAFSALANGGFLVQPYIIEIDPLTGNEAENKPIIKRQVLKKEISEEITGMLVKVVDEALLGGTVKVEHYSIAAKTGTAQIPLENQKGYSSDYLHTFIGYAPAYDAKFLIFLYLKRPKAVEYASHSLTPAFMDIMKSLLNYYEIPPDR